MMEGSAISTIKRNAFWDSVRGALMLIVVFGHAIQRCNGMETDNPLHIFIRCFQMEALMFVSGYVAAYSNRFNPLKYLKNKCNRLLVPYLLWVIPIWGILVAFGKVDFSIASFGHELGCSNFWFLRTLFLIFVAFIGYLMVQNKSKFVAAVIFFFAMFGISKLPGQELTLHYAIYFALGYAIHKIVPFEVRGGGNKWLNWIGKNSLAVYAVHWNLLFAYFPYRDLHLNWLLDNGLNIYVRSTLVFMIWVVITVVCIVCYSKVMTFSRTHLVRIRGLLVGKRNVCA